MTFHAVGCTGGYKEHLAGSQVANAMAAQISRCRRRERRRCRRKPRFLFHLGDVVYKDEDPSDPMGKDQAKMYNSQFYAQFAAYGREIFAVAGNHDGKTSVHSQKSAIMHFLGNFCDSKRQRSPDNHAENSKRLTMIQPYPYWLFETPVCYFVGLYTNDINGGQLDDPVETKSPQYRWLIDTLQGIKAAANGKAVFLALHYPPYSGAANFGERGNPNLGPTPRRAPPAGTLLPLGNILQQAFHESGQYPDLVLSAHAHSYQQIRLPSCRRLAKFLTWFVVPLAMVPSKRFPTPALGRVSPSQVYPLISLFRKALLYPREIRSRWRFTTTMISVFCG